MKIIDETGAVVENPDLTLGYLTDDTQPLEHPAQEAVAEVAHYETVAEYPGGGKDVQRVVDVPGVPARPAWTEQLPIKRYIRYTAEELAAQEEARKKQEAKDKLPETVAALNAALADADALNLDQDYRLTLLELGVTCVNCTKGVMPDGKDLCGPDPQGAQNAGRCPRPAAGRGGSPAAGGRPCLTPIPAGRTAMPC